MTLSLPPTTKSRSESPSNIVNFDHDNFRVRLRHKKTEVLINNKH